MFVLNGLKVNVDGPLTLGDVQYPAGFFRDEAARVAVGMVEVEDPVRKDDRFYFITENADGTLNQVAKPVEMVLPSLASQVRAKRDDLTANGGCKVGTNWFHSDTQSKLQQLALKVMDAAIPAGLKWKTLDGSFVDMDSALADQLFIAQVTREQAIFAAAEAHIAALNALTDVDAIAAYDLSAGWPEAYVPAAQ